VKIDLVKTHWKIFKLVHYPKGSLRLLLLSIDPFRAKMASPSVIKHS